MAKKKPPWNPQGSKGKHPDWPYLKKPKADPDEDPHIKAARVGANKTVRGMAEFSETELAALTAKLQGWVRHAGV